MTPEKKVQNGILNYFKKLEEAGKPIFYQRRQAGGFNYRMGIPDLYAVYDGRHVEIEVKQPGGELSPLQEKFRDKCKRLNILWMCAESLEEVKRFFYEHNLR